jgi:hypothetical protein
MARLAGWVGYILAALNVAAVPNDLQGERLLGHSDHQWREHCKRSVFIHQRHYWVDLQRVARCSRSRDLEEQEVHLDVRKNVGERQFLIDSVLSQLSVQ